MQTKLSDPIWVSWLKCLLIFLILSILFKAAYSSVSWFGPLSPWQAAALIHLVIAAYLIGTRQLCWRVSRLRWEPGLYLALFLIVVSLGAVWWSAGWDGLRLAFRWDSQDYLLLALVPVVEELVFRFGIGRLFKQRLGPLLGGYLSVLFFAWAHVLAANQTWLDWQFGLPIGPLLLGLSCEFFWQTSRKIVVPIVVHMAANMTALIFTYGDPSWLSILSSFYIGTP